MKLKLFKSTNATTIPVPYTNQTQSRSHLTNPNGYIEKLIIKFLGYKQDQILKYFLHQINYQPFSECCHKKLQFLMSYYCIKYHLHQYIYDNGASTYLNIRVGGWWSTSKPENLTLSSFKHSMKLFTRKPFGTLSLKNYTWLCVAPGLLFLW